MNEEQLKPISEQTKQIIPLSLPKTSGQTNNKKKETTTIITKLPEWNIEPPLEIKRSTQ